MTRLIPYPVLAGKTTLTVRATRVDDVPLPLAMISAKEAVVALHSVERTDWECARLSIQVDTPHKELAAGTWSDVACLAVLSERRTNARTVTRLREESSGTWTGEVVLYRDLHLDRAELTAQVVARVDGIDGRAIGATDDSWFVDLRERTPVRQKSIKTVWADFGDEHNAKLKPFEGYPWAVEAVGEEPTLYLNRGFEGLEALLRSGRRTDQPARGAIAAQIASEAWTALFNAAVHAVSLEDDRAQWPGGWRESALRRMLPDVYLDRSPDDALAEIVSRQLDRDGDGDLQTRVLHAAAKQARLPRNLGGLIRSVRRAEQEDE
jgi:hypothetical protein